MVNTTFWQNPPWVHGNRQVAGARRENAIYRMALAPQTGFKLTPASPAMHVHKQQLLESRYADVVATVAGNERAQVFMQQQLQPLLPGVALAAGTPYPDVVANVAQHCMEDLCLLDGAQQRLIAACVCAPSYWRLAEKIGAPLAAIHRPVPGLNKKIGARIQTFLQNMPVTTAFQRNNWFMHGDAQLFHPHNEDSLPDNPQVWQVRSERQTLYKISPRYVVFLIAVICEPLADIHHPCAADARHRLVQVLGNMDADEVEHFGGAAKFTKLLEYLLD